MGQTQRERFKQKREKRKRMWKVNGTALLLASFLSTPLRSSVSAQQFPAGDCMVWAQQKSISATAGSLWDQAACTVFMQHASPLLPSLFLSLCTTLHPAGYTVNTVRHRKQVDNNESDCGKSVCTQGQSFSCPVAFFLSLSLSIFSCMLFVSSSKSFLSLIVKHLRGTSCHVRNTSVFFFFFFFSLPWQR